MKMKQTPIKKSPRAGRDTSEGGKEYQTKDMMSNATIGHHPVKMPKEMKKMMLKTGH